MASSYDFFLSGDHEVARQTVANALIEQGYALETTPAGGLVATRGSLKKTMWLGAMAGKDFHISFIVEYFVDSSGSLVARLSRNMGAGALKGGALGANKVENAFIATVDGLGNVLTSVGLLTNRVAN